MTVTVLHFHFTIPSQVASKEEMISSIESELHSVQSGDAKVQVEFLVTKNSNLAFELKTLRERIAEFEEAAEKDKEKVVKNLKSALAKTRQELEEKKKMLEELKARLAVLPQGCLLVMFSLKEKLSKS